MTIVVLLMIDNTGARRFSVFDRLLRPRLLCDCCVTCQIKAN